jgi:hypothetical protein
LSAQIVELLLPLHSFTELRQTPQRPLRRLTAIKGVFTLIHLAPE